MIAGRQMQPFSSNPFQFPPIRSSLGEISIEWRVHDESTDRARSLVEFKRRVRREAAWEWMLLLGSALLVVVVTVGIVAVVMRSATLGKIGA
jgi:hypothetical protein